MATTYLTVGEAAARAGVHDRTVRRWMDEGRLPKYKTATGRVRVSASELDEITVPQADAAACTAAN